MPSFERMTGYYNYKYMKEVLEENKRLKALEKKTMEEYEMSVMMGEMDIEPQVENDEQQEPLETLQIRGNESELPSLATLHLMDIESENLAQEPQGNNVEDMDIDKSE